MSAFRMVAAVLVALAIRDGIAAQLRYRALKREIEFMNEFNRRRHAMLASVAAGRKP